MCSLACTDASIAIEAGCMHVYGILCELMELVILFKTYRFIVILYERPLNHTTTLDSAPFKIDISNNAEINHFRMALFVNYSTQQE